MKRSGFYVWITTFAFALLAAASVLAGGVPKPVSTNPEAQKLIDEAWQLTHTDSTVEINKKCHELLEQAHKLDPQNTDILNEEASCYWTHGDQLPKGTDAQNDARNALFAKGLETADKSLKIKETAGGHYWYAVNKSAGLESESIFSQAAGFPIILKHSNWVTDNEPDYDYGSTGRLWTEILARVPKIVVKMVGWDVQEAIDDIDKSIKGEPRYFDNYVYKANFLYVYFGEEKKAEALKLLESVLTQDPNVLPEEVTANKVAQRSAKEKWQKITGKEYPER